MDRPVRVVGVPTDYGVDRRGVDMGPSAIRYAGLEDAIADVGRSCIDAGDMSVPEGPMHGPADVGRDDAKFLDEVEAVTGKLADSVGAAIDDGSIPLVLGGDHSIAIGSAAGASRRGDVGICWFDAHGDYNTPATTPSGNVHGMSLAAILGEGEFADADWARSGVDPANVAVIGVRDLDDGERQTLRESDVSVFPMSAIDRRGISAVLDDAFQTVRADTDGVHLSLDLDWLDPQEAPGVGTPVRGGATYREAHTAMERVAETIGPELRSIELVEVNPILDRQNATAELAVELVASALGKRTF
jgi:arginase